MLCAPPALPSLLAAEQQKSTDLQNTSLMLASRKGGLSKSLKTFTDATELTSGSGGNSHEAELRKLDAQIVTLRRKHDQLHEKNAKRRAELDGLADKLKDLHVNKFDPKESAEERLLAMESRLVDCAAKYDDEHRLHMSYEQVISRLKKEQLEWPAEVKALEEVVSRKEADYEQLLMMSHEANASKEAAKSELSKFESLVQDERKQREKELHERRAVLQKKQQLANELERTEREQRAAISEQQRLAEEDPSHETTRKIEADIRAEQAKIKAYEAAFQQIKEATGVTDVNEVIQRFTLQEETHQNLLHMTRESQTRIDELRRAVEDEKALVMAAEYARDVAGDDGAAEPAADGTAALPAADGSESGRSSALEAQKQLNKARERWRKTLKTSASVKCAVQHLVDVLEPLREKDEIIAPMSDETLVLHMQFVESKLGLIASAFASMADEHKELLTAVEGPLPTAPPAALQKEPSASFAIPNADDSDDGDFEEDMEEDVIDRSALKKLSTSILDKGAKKKKPKRSKPRAKGADD